MNKFALPTLAAALALSACAESEAPADGEDGTETVVTQPAVEETTVIRETEGDPADPVVIEEDEDSSLTVDGDDVDATIDEDGVQAEIDVDGDN